MIQAGQLHRQPVNSPHRVDLWNALFSQLLAAVLIGDFTLVRLHLWCNHWRSTSGVPLLDTADWKKNSSLPADTLQTPLVHLHTFSAGAQQGAFVKSTGPLKENMANVSFPLPGWWRKKTKISSRNIHMKTRSRWGTKTPDNPWSLTNEINLTLSFHIQHDRKWNCCCCCFYACFHHVSLVNPHGVSQECRSKAVSSEAGWPLPTSASPTAQMRVSWKPVSPY